MTKTVAISEAKNKLTQLVRQVEAGDQVVITKDQQPVARIISEVEYGKMQRRLAVAGLRAQRERWLALGITGELLAEEARQLLEERP
ncbi:MAG: hypothetical protein A2Z21_01430 [Candidatus Fraserbacteria bacterium RBG_16_55_9]|uniref:Antitoxin n=1 Tax=Fraserbacteria sp. (strain RBG_16_55_9) TaxID=1817864 RepID=A0A1F5URA1_FRAXR|nr:MAG: hypothetical protein A2Z21_01430 [Candidatus Fraserbacteria bacterium RBG_16_55_9]